jgi:site-specific DNA-adenine methylase|tara:strand:- start:1550 stop:2416 length:867 start_codon:yes stop_codon:yes gene_type:complete
VACLIKPFKMRVKTPLRYPGGKSRAIKFLDTHLPKNRFARYCEPFLGGGSMALHITQKHPDVDVWVNDAHWPLYAFWHQLKCRGEELAVELEEIKYQTMAYPDAQRELFKKAKQGLESDDEYEAGKNFFIVNKCGFSGLASTFSQQAYDGNFTLNNIRKLRGVIPIIKDWVITNYDYKDVCFGVWGNPDYGDQFTFLDPPYDIKSFLYGKDGNWHRGFDHAQFHEQVKKIEGDWMITYNSNPNILTLWDAFTLLEWDLTYTMRSTGTYRDDQKKRKELLITNYKSDII